MEDIHIVRYENVTVRLCIPDLTDEERAKRMKQIGRAAAELVMSTLSETDDSRPDKEANVFTD